MLNRCFRSTVASVAVPRKSTASVARKIVQKCKTSIKRQMTTYRRPLSRLNMSKHICSYTTGCRFFSSDLNPEEATNIEAPALSNVSYNYVMSNLHLDPVYCADYVAEAFTYALFHAANPNHHKVAAEWLGTCMLVYRHRIEDWLGIISFYLFQSSSTFAPGGTEISDVEIEQMASSLLYACQVAWGEETIREWVKAFSQTPFVRERFPDAFEQAKMLYRAGQFTSLYGEMSSTTALAYDLEKSDSANENSIAEFIENTAGAWIDVQWARFFASGDTKAFASLVAAAATYEYGKEATTNSSKTKITTARSEASKKALASLLSVVYQNPLARNLCAELAQSESEKLNEPSPIGDTNAHEWRQKMISVCVAALRTAKNITEARGPFVSSKEVIYKEDKQYRRYDLLRDESSAFARLAGNAETDVILARFREITAEDMEIIDETNLANEFKDEKLVAELERVKEKWSLALEYPPQFASEQDKMQCIKDINNALRRIALNVDQVRTMSPLTAAALYQIGYNLDLPLSVIETNDTIEPISDIFYKKALDLDPRSGALWTAYGINLAQNRQADMAIWALKTAVSLGDANAYFPLGLQYFTQGQKEKALEAVRKYGEIDESAKKHADGVIKAMDEGSITMQSRDFGEK